MLSSGLLRFWSNEMLFAAMIELLFCLSRSRSWALRTLDLICSWFAPIIMLSTIDLLSAVVSWEDRGLVDILGDTYVRLVFGWKNSC
jgi:hypothetical protein